MIYKEKSIVSVTLLCTYKLAKVKGIIKKKDICPHYALFVKKSLCLLTLGTYSGNIWNLKANLREIIFKIISGTIFSILQFQRNSVLGDYAYFKLL